MKNVKYQRGMGLWPVMMGLALLGFVVFTALKLVPVYLEDFSVEKSVSGLDEDKTEAYRGAMSVQNAIVRRFGINNVQQVTRDDISVERDGQFYRVEVDYEVVIPYIGNISLLLHFNHKVSVVGKF